MDYLFPDSPFEFFVFIDYYLNFTKYSPFLLENVIYLTNKAHKKTVSVIIFDKNSWRKLYY